MTLVVPRHAFVSFFNYNTKLATSLKMKHKHASNDGTSAEWVIEGNGTYLADFHSVKFEKCVGSTKNHEFGLQYAQVDTIYSKAGFPALATVTITGDTVDVKWVSQGP